MSLYHFYLWYLRPKRLSPLLYGSFCLFVGIRSLVVGQGNLISFVLPSGSYDYICQSHTWPSFALMLVTYFVYSLFSRDMPRFPVWLSTGICAIWSPMIVLTPLRTYVLFDPYIQIMLGLE